MSFQSFGYGAPVLSNVSQVRICCSNTASMHPITLGQKLGAYCCYFNRKYSMQNWSRCSIIPYLYFRLSCWQIPF